METLKELEFVIKGKKEKSNDKIKEVLDMLFEVAEFGVHSLGGSEKREVQNAVRRMGIVLN